MWTTTKTATLSAPVRNAVVLFLLRHTFGWVSVSKTYVKFQYPGILQPPSARRDVPPTSVLPVDTGPVPNPIIVLCGRVNEINMGVVKRSVES